MKIKLFKIGYFFRINIYYIKHYLYVYILHRVNSKIFKN